MSSINTLFIFTSSGTLEVNKPEAKSIDEYNILFKRDIGSPGDSNARNKLIACAELYYIFLLYDVRSIYYNLPIKERKIQAKLTAKLPEKWKEDAVLQEAINRYKQDFELTSSGKAYATAERAYYTIARDTQELQEEIINTKELLQDKLKKIKSQKVGEIETNTYLSEANGIIADMLKNQKQIMDNIKQFSAMGIIVKDLAAKFIEEGGNIKIPVGGGTLGNRE